MIRDRWNAWANAMDNLSFHNPLFNAYAVAACLMVLKAAMMSWLTVVRMMRVNGGFRSPEDIKKTILNPNPSSEQLVPNEYVDRIRRIQLNDLENLPFFLVAGFLFILTEPPLALAQWLLYGYVVCGFFISQPISQQGLTIRAQHSGPWVL